MPVVANPEQLFVRCKTCNQGIPMPAGRARWVGAVLAAFEAEHQDCDELPDLKEEGGQRCRFTQPGQKPKAEPAK